MKQEESGYVRKKTAFAAVLVGLVLSFLTFLFIRGVQEQLWQQSIGTIRESTRQGLNTLQVQLRDEFDVIEMVADYLEGYTAGQEEEIDAVMNTYSQLDKGVAFYLEDGASYPLEGEADSEIVSRLAGVEEKRGILDPYITSTTGMRVFSLYWRVALSDGTIGYIVKEYEIENIVDSFSLSFYDDTGFSYVVDVDGNVLIRPPHPNSNKTIQNLFDMLPDYKNDPASLEEFKQALESYQSGWAVFDYQGENTVFCYEPLKLDSDWYLISIIPERVVNAQTQKILKHSLQLIFYILLGIAFLLFFYLRYARAANRRLLVQANYINHLYNAVPEGIALLTVERPHYFIQLNREGLRMLEYPDDASNDAPKGKSLEEIIYGEDYEQTVEIFKKAVTEGQKKTFENRVLKSDGSYFWASGIVENTLDENGNPILIATFHDVTEEKLAKDEAEREKLQERRLLVGAIANVYPVIVSLNLTRDTLNVIYSQPDMLFDIENISSCSQLYESIEAAIHPESAEAFKRRFSLDSLRANLKKERKEIYLELRQMLRDGQYHWISVQIIYVDNLYSEEQLAILIARRIDEKRYEEEQQRQALRTALDNARAASLAKSQFLSNMSHDIRTPMNAIVGMTAIAGTHLDEPDRVMECLKKISLSSRHLLSLINDVLDMSKIESGKVSIKEEPFNFAELVADTVELVRAQSDANHLKLEIQPVDLKNEHVIGDSLRISQVFINILSNAVKYTPAGGRVRIEVSEGDSTLKGYKRYVFRCEDTGLGMSPEFLSRLFQPFERSQDSVNSQIAGTGLGMAITKNLVDLMNGDIQVESEPQKGSAFTVILPLRLQEALEEEIPGEWLGIHSLIVDDDRKTCENAAELLENIGLHAEFVTEGKAAVSRVVEAKDSDSPFELIIIDWKMPDMDGIEVTRQIRTRVGEDVPVIILTAYDWSDIEQEAREAGVTAFLAKPFYRSKICYLLKKLSRGEEDAEKEHLSEADQDFDFTGKRILLVEDNAINREIARMLIEEMGIEVEEAHDGVEAVEMVTASVNGYYDLILMDIQMPRMNGYEATRELRAMERKDIQKIPVIAMTANAFEEDMHEALHAGMDAHFAKPIDVTALKQMLYHYLSGRNKSEEK